MSELRPKVWEGYLWMPMETVPKNCPVLLWDGKDRKSCRAIWVSNKNESQWVQIRPDGSQIGLLLLEYEPYYWTWATEPNLGQLSDDWRGIESVSRNDTCILVLEQTGNVYAIKDLQGLFLFTPLYWRPISYKAADTSGDPVDHPAHYTHPSGVECRTIAEEWSYNRGTALKYLWRAGRKEGASAVEDLRKAVNCLNAEIERLKRGEG